MRKYDITAKNGRAEIFLYGQIGDDYMGGGITAQKFAKDLRGLGQVKEIHLRINSDGGVVTDAQTIFNLLKEHPAKVHTYVDGIAASAASLIALAGDTVTISDGGYFMIHNARGGLNGEAREHRKLADLLDTVNEHLRDVYVKKTGLSEAKIEKMMDDETWFTAKEAVSYGFADTLAANMKIAACITDATKYYNKIPAALRPNRNKGLELVKRLRNKEKNL